jgi:hypothetical protein
MRGRPLCRWCGRPGRFFCDPYCRERALAATYAGSAIGVRTMAQFRQLPVPRVEPPPPPPDPRPRPTLIITVECQHCGRDFDQLMKKPPNKYCGTKCRSEVLRQKALAEMAAHARAAA